MGNLLGRADLRVHEGRLQFSPDSGATWAELPGVGLPRMNATLLPDSDTAINPNTTQTSLFILPAGRLTANRVLTVNNAAGDATAAIYIAVLDISAFTYTIRNDTPTVIYTKGASPGQGKVYSLFWLAGVWGTNVTYWT